MKKNLFFAFIACAALAFVSCEPTPQPVDYTISLNPTEVELEVGGSVKLNAVVSPAGEQAPTITWSSSNPEVATVNGSGIVEALATGTATITATLNVADGVKEATCVVNVTNDAVLNNFAIGDYGLFNIGNPIAGTDTVLEISVGEVNCQLFEGLFYVWDDNLVYADGVGFSGAGYMFTAEAPVYMIVDGDYAGAWINFGGVMVDTLPENTAVEYTAQHGQLVDLDMYGQGWVARLAATTQEEAIAAEELIYGAQTGTQLFYIDWDNMSQDFNAANVAYAAIIEDDSLGLLFDLKLEWYDWVNENRLYGLAVEEVITEAGDTTIAVVEPYDMRYIYKEYSNMPLEEEEEETTEVSAKSVNKVLRLNDKQTRMLESVHTMYKK